MADLQKTNAVGSVPQAMSGFGTITAPSSGATRFTTLNAPTFSVGDVVISGANTYYVKSVDTNSIGGYGFELSSTPGGTALTGTAGGAGFTAFATSTPTFQNFKDGSTSYDAFSAAGLQNINVEVDAAATIAANSTAKSTADSSNVTGDSASLADISFNSAMRATALNSGSNTNLVDVASDAGLSGIATTTASASASTSNGTANAFANLTDAAGISDLDLLKVGGELTALGKSVSTITGSAETVVGSANAAGRMELSMEGFEGSRMTVSSDASLQGLTSLTNTATAAATSGGNAKAEATAATIQGADLDGLKVGGTASLAGQASFGNTSDASNVVGNSVALSDLTTAQGLVATTNGLNAAGALNGAEKGINISSDASITGLTSITSKATAETTAGLADADSTAGDIDGAKLADALIGGVGSITGQATFNSAASASNVTKGSSNGNSTADSTLSTADGLQASDLLKVSSDATLKGLSSINMSATAESTGAAGATTIADALFNGGNVTGASLDAVEIGGIGNVLGQVGFTGAASASNVTGNADATGDLASAMGLETDGTMTVSSDGTLKGLTSVTGSATAATTAGDANAEARAGAINGADFGDLVDIGGIGSIQGAASFNLSAKSTNVTGDPATGTVPADSSSAAAGEGNLLAVGLKSFDTAGVENWSPTEDKIFDIKVASDATLSGTAIGSLKAEALSTATNALADLGGSSELKGAELTELHVGGIANVTGAAQLTGNATASSVAGLSQATSGFNSSVTGLTADLIEVASNATITAQAFGTHNATATSTGGGAFATAANTQLTGISEFDKIDSDTGVETVGLTLEIGGVGTVSALAQGSQNATATSVDGMAGVQAGMNLLGAQGLNFQSSSDGSLTAMAKLVANGDASNIGGSAKNDAIAVGNFTATGFEGLEIGDVTGGILGIGGISTLKGQAQITGTLNAESVSGNAAAGTYVPDGINNTRSGFSYITGMTGVELNGASDGTILGTASGLFNTTASSTLGDAYGFSGQNLRGISTLDLNLGGNGGINAIVTDTNFVTAHSVSGNATAEASVDAIGLEGGHTVHISGNATIMGNVGVDSKAEAHTTGG